MIPKPIAYAVLAAMGVAFAASATAATTETIRTGRLDNAATQGLANTLALSPGNDFARRLALYTAHGTLKTREQQTFGGVPVYGSGVVVERDVVEFHLPDQRRRRHQRCLLADLMTRTFSAA